ncbi:MAG: DUF1488 domain-containing protein [Proteobacteria bacterium]|nr:DUF1488 domain-containing protein [Pseudomonadota bacterium]
MKLTQYKSSLSNNSKILFPKLESWNPMNQVATIAAQVDKKRVLCRISKEVLELVSKDKETDPMNILLNNRYLFEEKARKLIESKAYEEDGSIIIRKADM